MRIKGRDLMVFAGSGDDLKCIAFSTQCELDVDCDVKEVAGFSSGRWREYIAGRCGWSMKVACLLSDEVENGFDLFGRMEAGDVVDLCFSTVAESNDRRDADSIVADDRISRYGSAYVTSIVYTGTNRNMATYQAEFTGSGQLVNKVPLEGIDNTTEIGNKDLLINNL